MCTYFRTVRICVFICRIKIHGFGQNEQEHGKSNVHFLCHLAFQWWSQSKYTISPFNKNGAFLFEIEISSSSSSSSYEKKIVFLSILIPYGMDISNTKFEYAWTHSWTNNQIRTRFIRTISLFNLLSPVIGLVLFGIHIKSNFFLFL